MKDNNLEIIERYINGIANEKEKSFVESLFLNGENNNDLKDSLKKDWNFMLENTSSSDLDLNYLLDRVHHTIRKNETLRRKKPINIFFNIYAKVAAILLLPLLISGGIAYYYIIDHQEKMEDKLVSSSIYAPLGARVSFNLPDGTVGMLNSGSRLSYSIPFSNNRNVRLEGEAWFEVKRDKNHPFEISAGNSNVKVLGTSFNLSAYCEENYVEVVLQKGKVEFENNTGDEKMEVLPSERLVFQGGKISKSVADPAKYNAWTEGKLVFRGDLMAEVARRIERWYNVKVYLADKELEKYSFRATFEDDKLEEVLRLLSLTSPLRYKIIPRKALTDGTYEKEQVTIFLKKQ